MKQTREPAGLALGVAVVTAILIGTSPTAQRRYPPRRWARMRQVQQTHDVILMTTGQPISRQAAFVWRTARRAAGALTMATQAGRRLKLK